MYYYIQADNILQLQRRKFLSAELKKLSRHAGPMSNDNRSVDNLSLVIFLPVHTFLTL
jgi:hypothetical protein